MEEVSERHRACVSANHILLRGEELSQLSGGASHRAAAPREAGGTREKELTFIPLRPVLQGNKGLGWHFLSCQVMSHYFLWLSSPTSCSLQSRYPIYQLETDIKARGFHPLLPGEQAAPAQNTGVLEHSYLLRCSRELPA